MFASMTMQFPEGTTEPPPGSLRRLPGLIEVAIIACIVAAVYCHDIGLVKFHPDESQWIATSVVFEEYFTARFSSPHWNESYWTLTQPPVARYFIGLGRWLGGYQQTDLNRPWLWGQSEAANIQSGAMPSDGLLGSSRLPMALLAVVSITISFVLLHRSVGKVAAYAWIILSLLSLYFLVMLRRAMGEAPLLAGIVFSAYACSQALSATQDACNSRRARRVLAWMGLMGIGIGIAGASKLNGLIAVFAGVATIIIIALRRGNPFLIPKRLFSSVALGILIFSVCLTFLGLNPYLWRSPARRLERMLELRLDEISYQQDVYPYYRIDGLAERAEVLPERVLVQFSAMRGSGVLFLNAWLLLTGLGYLTKRSWDWLADKDADPAAPAILLMGVATALPVLVTPLDWDRYYLFAVYFSTLCIASGIGWHVLLARHWWGKKDKIRLQLRKQSQ